MYAICLESELMIQQYIYDVMCFFSSYKIVPNYIHVQEATVWRSLLGFLLAPIPNNA